MGLKRAFKKITKVAAVLAPSFAGSFNPKAALASPITKIAAGIAPMVPGLGSFLQNSPLFQTGASLLEQQYGFGRAAPVQSLAFDPVDAAEAYEYSLPQRATRTASQYAFDLGARTREAIFGDDDDFDDEFDDEFDEEGFDDEFDEE